MRREQGVHVLSHGNCPARLLPRFQYPGPSRLPPGCKTRRQRADTGRYLPCIFVIIISINNKIYYNIQVVSSRQPELLPDGAGELAFRDGTLYIAATRAHEILRMNPENSCTEALHVTKAFAEI